MTSTDTGRGLDRTRWIPIPDPLSWAGLWRRFCNLFRSDVPTEQYGTGHIVMLQPSEQYIGVPEKPAPPPCQDIRW